MRHIAQLHYKVYGERLSTEFFRKKYNTIYTGKSPIGYIAYTVEGKPVAAFAFLPCFIKYENRLLLAGQAADAMTLREHQKKGLFVEMVNRIMNDCNEQGVDLLFGFPNQFSYEIMMQKFGWKETERLLNFTISVRASMSAALLKRLPVLKGLYAVYKEKVLAQYTLLLNGVDNSVIREGYAGIDRSGEYFDYKGYTGSIVVKAGEGRVWLKVKDAAYIGDIERRGEDIETIVSVLKELAGKLGIKAIYFQASGSVGLAKAFAELYEGVPAFNMIYKVLRGDIDADKIKFTFADADVF